MRTLEDEGARAELLGQLNALLAARRAAAADRADDAPSAGLASAVAVQVSQLGAQVSRAAQIVGELPAVVPWLEGQIADPDRRTRWLLAVAKLAAIIVAGLVAELVAARLLAAPRRRFETLEHDRWTTRLPMLAGRTVVDLVPIAAFFLAAQAIVPILEPRPATLIVALAIIQASVLARLIMAASRSILTPRVGALRPLPIADETANYTHIWVRRFAFVGVYGYFFAAAVHALGLPDAGYAILLKLIGLLLTGQAATLILQLRQPVRRAIAGDGAADSDGGWTNLRARLADIWHVLALLYLVGVFATWVLELAGGFAFVARATLASLVVLALAKLADVIVVKLLARLFRLRDETRARYPGLEARANLYLPVARTVIRAVVWIIAAVAVLQAWGIDVVAWLASDAGRTVIATVVQVAVVIVGALLLLELVNAAVERYLARDDAGRAGGMRPQRIRTLLPLLRNVLRAAVAVFVVLIVLSELGIDIAPLLAGAGIVGLAIGFGAQKLVQDIITGLFILIEDTVGVGDVVNVAGHVGVVEAIPIRTIRLRDLAGTVHTVPFSEVTTIENLTEDYSYAVIDVGVAYREDTDEVVALLEQVADELRADADHAANILEPLEVLGVDALADSAVVIKVRLKTVPIKQWSVKREFNRRMKKLFDDHGIEIPFPHTTIYFGTDHDGAAPPAHVAVEQAGGPPAPRPAAAPARPAAPRPAPAQPADLPE